LGAKEKAWELSTKFYQPFRWGDYLRDTGSLSLLEHGAYLRLIGEYWNTGKPIPADASRIRRACGVQSDEDAKSAQYVLERYFYLDGEVWRHKTIDEDLAKESERALKKSEAARTAANARWANEDEMPAACVTHATHSTPLHNQSPIIITPEGMEGSQRGVAKNGNRGFDILQLLSDKGLEAARRAADGWDIYRLAATYNNGLGARGEPPRYPDKAFAAWCEKYTKGRPPA
jgi:uncharacterized protein YdaU (DUF1376 family)